jgi:DNA-binding winged helix-turn-helix (wHTH) protein/cytochrome c-type biogenesis protein CcmH/NrfG/TolB-like protein
VLTASNVYPLQVPQPVQHKRMPEQQTTSRRFAFADFILSPQDGTLVHRGHKVRLQDQPLRLLALLVEQTGTVVTREEIQAHLWPENTYVEFDKSLRVAVNKVREALRDSADRPNFIETVPRRGYRFIAPVTVSNSDSIAASPWNHSLSQPIPPLEENLAEPARIALPVTPQTEAYPTQTRNWLGSRWIRISLMCAAVLLLGASVLGVNLYRRQSRFQLSAQDSIVVADFENTTGDGIFDDALRQALLVGIQQSPDIQTVSDRKTAVILKQMGHSSEDRINGQLGFQLCQRVGAKALLQGSISRIGSAYLVGLAAIRCDNGKLIAHEQVEADDKEDVVDALGKVTEKLRERLGESLPSIRRYNAPLEQATTPSLDALKTYSLALSTWDAKGDAVAIPMLKKAIEIDPNFAMAYGALADMQNNLGDSESAQNNATRAFQLRDRVTEPERDSIDARYYHHVTGELDKQIAVYERHLQNYPDTAMAYSELGVAYANYGDAERGATELRKALLMAPERANAYGNLAEALLMLDKTDEAEAVLKMAADRSLRTDFLMQVSYWDAFLHNDSAAMEQVEHKAASVPGAQSLLLSEQANTFAFHGQFKNSLQAAGDAAKRMQLEEDKPSAALTLARSAVWEAEAGASQKAQALIAQAIKLDDSKEVETFAALVAIESGQSTKAIALCQLFDRQSPSATFIQKYWLPVLRARIALQQKDPQKAIQLLSAAQSTESAITDEFSTSSLYPAYVRGQAYLLIGNGQAAELEFQKLVGHPGLVLNTPLAALARLQLARAYTLEGDSSKALSSYRDFLALWKDADRDTPVLVKASAELAQMQNVPRHQQR